MSRRISSPVFVGRAQELAQLGDALDRATRGEPATVLLAGEAGVGKTRLLTEFGAQAQLAGALVVAGGSIDLGEDGPSYAPLAEALRSIASRVDANELLTALGPGRSDLARLAPELGNTPRGAATTSDATSEIDPSVQVRLFDDVLRLVGRLAVERPIVLAFEDLHWADRSTRDLVRFLVRNFRREAVLFIASYRSDDLHRRHPLLPLLGELERLPSVERVDLRRFDRSELADQVAGILGERPDPARIERLFDRSDGNAFFVEEIVAAGGLEGRTLPASVRDIVAARVSSLSASANDVLRVAAVVGRTVEHETLLRLAGVEPAFVLEGLREAVSERFLMATDDADRPMYEFRHALTQEVLYDDVLPAERTVLHAAVAGLLEARLAEGMGPTRSMAEIAYHWYRAHDARRALAASLRAADEATRVVALGEAQSHLERVLELWPRVPDAATLLAIDRSTLLERAAEAAAAAGSLTRAVALQTQALRDLGQSEESERTIRCRHALIKYLWDTGDTNTAEAYVAQALENAQLASPRDRALMLADMGEAHWHNGRYPQMRAVAEEAIDLAVKAGDRAREAWARGMLGGALGSLGDVVAGIEQVEQAQAMAIEDRDTSNWLSIWLTHVLDLGGFHARAASIALADLGRMTSLGVILWWGLYQVSNALGPLITLGRWSEADNLIERIGWLGEGNRAGVWVAELEAELAILRGDLPRARTAVSAARSQLSDTAGIPDLMWIERVEGLLAHAEGRMEDARRRFEAIIGRSHDAVHDLPLYVVLLPALETESDIAVAAEARRDVPAVEEARRRGVAIHAMIIAMIETGAGRLGPIESVLIAQSAALRCRLDGEPDPLLWAAAADAMAHIGRPHDIARARYRAAEALLTTGGDRARATALLRDAVATASDLGARPLAAAIDQLAIRARIDLAAGGGRAAAAGSAPRVAIEHDPFRLSPREREVLAFLAQGHTNREIGDALFISEKTASVHVTHILNKLGVSSRVEAALVADRAGMTPTSSARSDG